MIWPRISWALTARAKRKIVLIIALLALIILVLSSNWFWQQLYPIHHQELIRTHANANGVDPRLVAALIRVESKFDASNTSHVGAVGLMQLMPETADWIAQQSGIPYHGEQDLSNPETNIKLGTWYIAYLTKQYQGNSVMAVAAYNAGPGRVSRWLSTNVWDGAIDTTDRIPVGETRHYVQRVFFNYEKYQQFYPDFK
ncbi:MAG: lytic transglycosylase domain-containing protein [Tumebacillaceae bacterium]